MKGTLNTGLKTCRDCIAFRRVVTTDDDNKCEVVRYKCMGVSEPFVIKPSNIDSPCTEYPPRPKTTEFKSAQEFIELLNPKEQKELYHLLCAKIEKNKDEAQEKSTSITKEDFVKTMNFIKDRLDFESEMSNFFTKEFGDCVLSIYTDFIDLVGTLVAKLLGGGDNTVKELSDYIYAYNCGRNPTFGESHLPDYMKTPEVFYDYLTSEIVS